MPYQGTKRRVFISHFRDDSAEVEAFIDYFVNQHGSFYSLCSGCKQQR